MMIGNGSGQIIVIYVTPMPFNLRRLGALEISCLKVEQSRINGVGITEIYVREIQAR